MSKGKKNKRKNNSRICKLPHEKKKKLKELRGKEEKKEKKTKEKKGRRKTKRMMKWGMR